MLTHTHEGTSFIYNSDLSGEVRIVRPDGAELVIEGMALRGFIEGFIHGCLSERLEGLDVWKLLTGRDEQERIDE